MRNPNPNTSGLKQYKPTWNSGQTRTIRVPIALADQTLAYARQLDNTPVSSDIIIETGLNREDIQDHTRGDIHDRNREDVHDRIGELLSKVDNKESGYKSNGAGKLIQELRKIYATKE